MSLDLFLNDTFTPEGHGETVDADGFVTVTRTAGTAAAGRLVRRDDRTVLRSEDGAVIVDHDLYLDGADPVAAVGDAYVRTGEPGWVYRVAGPPEVLTNPRTDVTHHIKIAVRRERDQE